MRIISLAMIGCSLASVAPASATTVPPSLRIVIEDLSSGAANCQISKSDIQTAISSAMRYNRISESKAQLGAFVYAQTTIIYLPSIDGCVSQNTVAVYQMTTVKPTGTDQFIFANAQLCEHNAMLVREGTLSIDLPPQIKTLFDKCISSLAAERPIS